MNATRHPQLAHGLCFLLGFMCLGLAVGNYNDQENLIAATAAFPLISEKMASWAAAWIWAFQFVFGLFVMFPLCRRFASLGLAGMFLGFLTVALYRLGFGVATTASFYTKFDPLAPYAGACAARDALFATVAFFIYLCYFPRTVAPNAAGTTQSPLTPIN